eukprot:8999214-Pyramimonas_sp.AAC.1
MCIRDRSEVLRGEFAHLAPSSPPSVFWALEPEEFQEALSRVGDSAPGPDGLPYAAWKGGGDGALSALYALYSHILAAGE